jgi:hypothetical protein
LAIAIVRDDDASGFYCCFGAFEPFSDDPVRLLMPIFVARQR